MPTNSQTNPEAPPLAGREALEAARPRLLSGGRWGNANILLVEIGNERWAVKDFRHCPTPVRQLWGTWMVRRELRALRRLAGIPGIPTSPFRVDAYALGYRFIEGHALKQVERRRIPANFFVELESLVRSLHERNIVHLDLRNRRNILVTPDWRPALLDFQSHFELGLVPRPVRSFLERIDLSGVYKYWSKIHPESLGEERAAVLAWVERWRPLWRFRGYAGIKRSHAPSEDYQPHSQR